MKISVRAKNRVPVPGPVEKGSKPLMGPGVLAGEVALGKTVGDPRPARSQEVHVGEREPVAGWVFAFGGRDHAGEQVTAAQIPQGASKA